MDLTEQRWLSPFAIWYKGQENKKDKQTEKEVLRIDIRNQKVRLS